MCKYYYYLLTVKTRGSKITEPYELLHHYNQLKSKLKRTEFSDLIVLEYARDLHLHTIVISQNKYPTLLKNKTSRVYSHFEEFDHSNYSKVHDYLLKQVPDKDTQTEVLHKYHLSKFNYWSNKCDYHNMRFYNLHPIKL